MTTERTALYRRRVPARPRSDDVAPGQAAPTPGLLRFRGWGLEQRLGDDRRALIEALRKDIEAMREGAAAEVHLRARRARRREAGRPAGARCAAIRCASATRCRAASSSVLSPASRATFPRAAAGSSSPTPSPRSRSRCASSSIASGRGTSAPASSNTPSNFGMNGERPDASRAARLPGAVLRRPRACRSRRCTARSC